MKTVVRPGCGNVKKYKRPSRLLWHAGGNRIPLAETGQRLARLTWGMAHTLQLVSCRCFAWCTVGVGGEELCSGVAFISFCGSHHKPCLTRDVIQLGPGAFSLSMNYWPSHPQLSHEALTKISGLIQVGLAFKKRS